MLRIRQAPGLAIQRFPSRREGRSAALQGNSRHLSDPRCFQRHQCDKKIREKVEEKKTFLIAGLGNPGAEYEHTRHNAGFDTVDALADELGC